MTNNTEYQAAVNQLFAQPNRADDAVCEWLSSFLKGLDWSSLKRPGLHDFRSQEPYKLSPELQIALLKSCLELMVRLREERGLFDSPRGRGEFYVNFDIGTVLYRIALGLFRRPLPFSESDICEILQTTRHDCGHGEDVLPPFKLALEYAREHDLSANLLASIRLYVDRMAGLRSCKVQNVRRKADLLLTLDETVGKKRCWSECFRKGLAELPKSQQQKWRAMVVEMDAIDYGRNRENWKAKSPRIIERLGANHILISLSAWWPSPNHAMVWPLGTGASYILQHFVWLLGVIAEDDRYCEDCDSLILLLSELDWRPREGAQKVMIAAAKYLEQRPPAVAWRALQRLNTWSEFLGKKASNSESNIPNIVRTYSEKHRLSQHTESAR